LRKTAPWQKLGVVTKQVTTEENINKLIEFRQAIYDQAMTARRDALFDLLDALVTTGSVSSFAKLSQSSYFRRKWPSIYAAIEDGRIDSTWLRKYLAQSIAQTGISVFALDGSSWPRPRARTLEDRQYVFQASSDVNGGTVTIGYPYSMLEWIAEPHSSWSLPIDVRRVESAKTAQAVGAEQIQALAEARKAFLETLDIVAGDGKYGNCGFLDRSSNCAVELWSVCAVIEPFVASHRRRQPRRRKDDPKSMGNASHSKIRTPGGPQMRCLNWKTRVGVR